MDEELQRLLDLLDATEQDTVNTSVRMPVPLRDAAALATSMGLAPSITALTVAGLSQALAATAQRAVLDAHYRQHPGAKPSLAEIALAVAELDGNPLAAQPALIRRAAEHVAALRSNPDADDVLLFAAGLAAAA